MAGKTANNLMIEDKHVTIRDGSSPQAGEVKKSSLAERTPTARELGLRKRIKVREEQACVAKLATASTINPFDPVEKTESFASLSAQEEISPNKTPNSSQALQLEQHHCGTSRRQPSPEDGLFAEQMLKHNSRKTNVSDHEQEKLPKLKLPPSGDSKAWREINSELEDAIPLVFPKSRVNSTDVVELSEQFDYWLYCFLRDKYKQENQDPPAVPQPHGNRPKRTHAGLEILRKEKKQCRAARNALRKAGLLGTPEEAAISKRWWRLVRQHNRLRIALKKHQNGLDAAAAERKFKADPNKFAYELFDESVANSSPTFDEKTAQDYFAKT